MQNKPINNRSTNYTKKRQRTNLNIENESMEPVKRPKMEMNVYNFPRNPVVPVPAKPAFPLSIRIPPVKIQNLNNSMNEEDMAAYTVNTETSEWTVSPGNTRYNDSVPMNLKLGFTRISPASYKSQQTPKIPTSSPPYPHPSLYTDVFPTQKSEVQKPVPLNGRISRRRSRRRRASRRHRR